MEMLLERLSEYSLWRMSYGSSSSCLLLERSMAMRNAWILSYSVCAFVHLYEGVMEVIQLSTYVFSSFGSNLRAKQQRSCCERDQWSATRETQLVSSSGLLIIPWKLMGSKHKNIRVWKISQPGRKSHWSDRYWGQGTLALNSLQVTFGIWPRNQPFLDCCPCECQRNCSMKMISS